MYYFSVNHNLPSIDLNLPWSPCHFCFTMYPMNGRSYLTSSRSWFTLHAFLSKNIFFIHPLWRMNSRSLFTLPTKGGPFSKISHWKSHWTDGFLKDLNCFFSFQKSRKSKNALYYQKKTYDFFIFVEKLKKMQPPKMTFRSQLEPSIKSYECFMFLLNFRLEMTLD